MTRLPVFYVKPRSFIQQRFRKREFRATGQMAADGMIELHTGKRATTKRFFHPRNLVPRNPAAEELHKAALAVQALVGDARTLLLVDGEEVLVENFKLDFTK